MKRLARVHWSEVPEHLHVLTDNGREESGTKRSLCSWTTVVAAHLPFCCCCHFKSCRIGHNIPQLGIGVLDLEGINCELILWSIWCLELQLERTAKLISRLRAHLEKVGLSQVTLSKELGLSPAALSEVMRGKNSPSAEVALHMLELLESKPMSTPLFEPKPDRPPRVQDPDNPMTLGAARERISELNAQLRSSTATLPVGNTQASPTAGTRKPVVTTSRLLSPPPTAMEREIERARAARMEGLSSKPLAQQTVRELQAALNNAKPEDQGAIYSELKSREGDTALRAFKAGRR